MSIQYMDNFSIYGTSEAAMVAGPVWSTVSGSSLEDDPDGVSGGKVLEINDSVSTQPTAVMPTASDVVSVSFRWYCTSLPIGTAEGHDVELRDGSGNIIYVVRVTPTGALILTNTDGAGTRIDDGDLSGFTDLVTTGNVILSGVWQHIEWIQNTTTGAYTIYVEGVSVATGTDGSGNIPAVDAAIITWRNEWRSSAAATQTAFIKDFIIADDAGSVNNGQIGTVQVITLTPDSDTSSGWTRSAGTTDYELVDETTPDDADFIQAEDDPLPSASIMGLSNLPDDVVAVRALQTMVRALKSDAGDATMVVSLKSNGSDDDGATKAITTSAAYHFDISELDPDGGSSWTPAKVDLAEIQIDRTA